MLAIMGASGLNTGQNQSGKTGTGTAAGTGPGSSGDAKKTPAAKNPTTPANGSTSYNPAALRFAVDLGNPLKVAAQSSGSGAKAAPKAATTGTDSAPADPRDHSKHIRATDHNDKLKQRIAQLHGDINSLNKKKGLLNITSAIPFLGIIAKPVMQAVAGNNIQKDISKDQSELGQAQTLNFLADTMYRLGAPEAVVNAITGGQKIEVVPDSKLNDDAAYDSKTKTIQVSQSTMDQARKDLTTLEQQGAVNSDGTVTNVNKLDASSTGDNAAKYASLIGAHEATHAKQADDGTLAKFNSTRQDIQNRFQQRIQTATSPDQRNQLRQQEDGAINDAEVRIMEVPAYHAQEVAQNDAGAPGKVTLTMDANGNELPIDQQVANVKAFEDDTTIQYGPSAGDTRSDPTAAQDESPVQDAQMAKLAAAYARLTPAQRNADFAFSGMLLAGGHFPGGHFPGGHFPGGHFPGGHFPGGHFPGGHFPGGHFPGGAES
jgi:hypothetical protein